MQVGVLAVQGAFAEMEAYWREEGADVFEIRQLADLGRPMDLLALPGGESTVQGKLLNIRRRAHLGTLAQHNRLHLASGAQRHGLIAKMV